MEVTGRVLGMAMLFGAVVVLLTLLNQRDRRSSRLRRTVLDQLALPELRGRVGVYIRCAVFSRRRAVIVDLLGGTPHEVWNVFTRLASRLPPRVRLVVHDTPDSGFTRPFALETTIGRLPPDASARRSSMVGVAPMDLRPARLSRYGREGDDPHSSAHGFLGTVAGSGPCRH
jgi:hypothetical protein